MRFGERVILFTAMSCSLAACNGQVVIPTPLSIVPTVAPLTARAMYWDVGLSINYPENWIAPVYSAGEMMIVPGVSDITPHEPLVDPVITMQAAMPAQLNATKDTSLDLILTEVSGARADTVELARHTTTFAELDALFSIVQDKKQDLFEETVAFRLPDARIGWVVVLAPGNLWGDLAPTLQNVLGSAKFLIPSDYQLPASTSTPGRYAPGGLGFILPDNWTGQAMGDVVVYHADQIYQDGSGFSNGPQLVFRALSLPTNADISAVLAQTLGTQPSAVQPITVGAMPGIIGAQYTETDPVTSQQVTFIAVPSADRATLTILRWTTPAVLIQTTRPILDLILHSLTYASSVPFQVK